MNGTEIGEDGLANGKVSELDGEAPEATDFANYFCTYAYLYHQKVCVCVLKDSNR